MEDATEHLFAGFPPVSPEAWEEKIRGDLKGADYQKKLIWQTLEGFAVKPFYTVEDLQDLHYLEQDPGRFPFLRSEKTEGNPWLIRQDFRVYDVDSAVVKAGMALRNGVTSLGFDTCRKGDLYYHDFRKMVSDVLSRPVSLNLIAGDASPDTLDFLLKAMDELRVDPETARGSLEYDPMGQLAASGGFYRSLEEDFSRTDRLLMTAENDLPGYRVLPVNSHLFSDAGASAVQELAYGLSMASEYFTRLTDMGHSAEDIARHMQWGLGAGTNYFMEIAKIRAARMLFSTMLTAYDATVRVSVFIHSMTTHWNKTIFDPYVNQLRLTTEAMAAVLGGCNSLLVKPFDACIREPGDFSERLARNIQIILKEESYLDRVTDPSAGSYYIESLTASLVKHAWELFLNIDGQGGFIKAFLAGEVKREIGTMSTRRRQMVGSRREILVGTNQFPNFNEVMHDQVVPAMAFPVPVPGSEKLTEPLDPGRASEDFEILRLATENHPSGRPKVFMLTYGNLAMRLARSQFSCNFFACAGYEVIDNLGFSTPEDGVDAARKAGADIVVLCSSDDAYETLAPKVFNLLEGRTIMVVAGAPACMDDLKQQGITEFIHVRSQVLDTLMRFHQKLGINLIK
jgi:methylmalonyl-CoA mutase